MPTNYSGTDYWPDDITLIRLSDAIAGGTTSRTNTPSKELTDRTLWLKNRIAWNDIIWADTEDAAFSTGTKKTYYAPFDMLIERVNIQAVNSPESTAIADIHLEGDSIFVSSSRPQLTSGDNYAEVILDTTSTPVSGRDSYQVSKDEKLEIIVDDAGSGGEGMKVVIVARRDFDGS